ncbi:MAG TPA: type II secretion system F family protein [Candidatus Hydrogenedentes bacterium]|nr:type II secretion system F family protein [Candidatus Hydrogenedentota bacterium]HPX40441.1 type II secretion system F family protein [Candidatus Hydrogenedentota bacterium]HQM31951.1 type II secretion system F family protein [Candidatus Hydrogenedentota bacterium]
MPLFKYRAVDENGRAATGTMEETSARQVTALLRERGLQVNSVEPVEPRWGIPRLGRRLTWEEVSLFNEQLTAITRGNLPLVESLRALAVDVDSPRLRPVFAALQRDLEGGATLEEALVGLERQLPPTYVSAIRAGERTGNLPGVLAMLGEESARMVTLKNDLRAALAYPILVVIAAALVLGFLLRYVVPEFASIFEDFGASLPWVTRFMLDASECVQRNWIFLLSGLGIAVALLFVWWRGFGHGRARSVFMDRVRLLCGPFGRMYYAVSLSRFLRNLAMLEASEVPLVEGLGLSAAASGNAVLVRAVAHATSAVSQGEPLSKAFEDAGFFDHTLCWLLATAEERGDVIETLRHLANMYARNAERLGSALTTAVTPALLVFLGITVGGIVVAMYLPIFSLADVMSGI